MNKKYKYAIVKGDEDGETIRFYTESELKVFLKDMVTEGYDYKFVAEDWIDGEGGNSRVQYWGEENIMILKIETIIPTAKDKVTEWMIE